MKFAVDFSLRKSCQDEQENFSKRFNTTSDDEDLLVRINYDVSFNLTKLYFTRWRRQFSKLLYAILWTVWTHNIICNLWRRALSLKVAVDFWEELKGIGLTGSGPQKSSSAHNLSKISWSYSHWLPANISWWLSWLSSSTPEALI